MRKTFPLRALRHAAALLVLVLSALFVWVQAEGASAAPELSAAEIQMLGERMYRQGILSDGTPMKAYVSGDVPVDGTSFTCVSCHLRSGLGSVEGEVVTTPTNGRILYQERKPFKPGAEFVPSISNYAKNIPVRPAYTDKTLADLLTTGIDPTGRSLLAAMPRYDIPERDMAILIAYLKTLSDKPSPGVSESHISFATVIVEGSDPKAVESMLAPLEFSVERKNSLAKASSKNFRVARMGYNMLGDLHSKTFSLSRWVLKGPPSTWRRQLEEYYGKEPVFALLGGISSGEWEPVHRFCEENRIPCLFPVVDYPVISDTDWYTLYPSRGVRLEGETAARYLNSMSPLLAGKPILQIQRGTRGSQTRAAGFRETWQGFGNGQPAEVTLPDGAEVTPELLRSYLDRHQPAVLIIWDDHAWFPALAAAAGGEKAPGMVIMSGPMLGDRLLELPEKLRDLVYLTYPYRLPHEDARFDALVQKVIPGKSIAAFDRVTLKKSYMASEVLGKALMEMRGEFYRDFLLDTIGMMTDMYYPLFERVSFGPGQRYASKGCYLVQVGKGKNPRLERRSEWVVP